MIRLRPLKLSDSKAVAEWFPEERQFAMWSVGQFAYPLTAEQIAQHLRKLELQKDAWSMAALDESGELVGHFMVKKADYETESAFLGFIVVNPLKRGKGYGKEMVAKAVQYAFEILGVENVTLNVIEENKAAYACYTSLGFRENGHTENMYQYKNEEWDVCHMLIQKNGGSLSY